MLDGGGIGFFGDDIEEGGIGGPTNFPFGLDLREKLYQVFFNYMPSYPVETDRETLWPRGFVRMKGPDGLLDFIFRDGAIHGI